MATIKKASTRLGRLAQKGETKKVDRIVNRIDKKEDRRDARLDRRIARKSDRSSDVSMKPLTPIAAKSVTDRQSMKPIKPLAARVGPANLKLGKQSEGKPAKIATGPRATLATEKTPAAAAESFGQAFRRNKDAKAKTFTHNNKSYTTETKEDVAKKAAPVKKAETTTVKSASTPHSGTPLKSAGKSQFEERFPNQASAAIEKAKATSTAKSTAKSAGKSQFEERFPNQASAAIEKAKATSTAKSTAKPAAKPAEKKVEKYFSIGKTLGIAKCGTKVSKKK